MVAASLVAGLTGPLQVRFPATSFVSRAEFESWSERFAGTLAARSQFEQTLVAEGAPLVQVGTCAPCLRPAALTSYGTAWAREQACDCEDALPGQARALLHAAIAEGGLQPWSRLLVMGPAAPVHRRLRALAAEHDWLPEIPAEPAGQHHLLVADDCLQRVPDLAQAASRLCALMAPGGCLLASLPFRHRAAHSHRRPDATLDIGWDVLALLRAAGFIDATVLLYWSNQLGYLGAHNFILKAVS